MFDHLALSVGDFEASRAFYQAALAALGHQMLSQQHNDGRRVVGFGDGQRDLWLGDGGSITGGIHVAFRAPDRAAVDAFHAAALAAGGRDNGAPGLRARYHPHYYAAYVLDPDGNNVEAVCHTAGPRDRASDAHGLG